MKLSPSFRLPYVDPQGYDIVTPTDLQLLAERVDSAVAGFDARTSAVFSKPTMVRGMSANSYNGVVDAAGQPGDVGPDFDVVRYNNSAGAIVFDGSVWSIDPAKRNPDCYVLASLQLEAHVNGAIDAAGAWMRSIIEVWDASQNIGRVRQESYYTTQYLAGVADEDGTITMILRMKPRTSLSFSFAHSNAASSMYVAATTTASLTYLMSAS